MNIKRRLKKIEKIVEEEEPKTFEQFIHDLADKGHNRFIQEMIRKVEEDKFGIKKKHEKFIENDKN